MIAITLFALLLMAREVAALLGRTSSLAPTGMPRAGMALASSLPSIPIEAAAAASTFTPPVVGPDIWVGTAAALVPVVWGGASFVGRVRIQQRCAVCQGSGLTRETKAGGPLLSQPRKCWNCGGFIPWKGWRSFFWEVWTVGGGRWAVGGGRCMLKVGHR